MFENQDFFKMNSKTKGDVGEAFVNNIAFSAFLKHWCYPNPLDLTKDNKEICDLLIIFNDICVIVSVKNYSFSGNYEKYFKRTVDKALRQILGAERKLFGDRQILLKHPDRPPEIFPKEKIKTVLRIIVNSNTAVKFYNASIEVDDSKHVAIFDADAWQALVTELNTIHDFVDYLRERYAVINKRPAVILPRDEYDFTISDGDQFLAEGEKLQKNHARVALISGSERDLIAVYIMNGFQFPEKLYKAEEPFLFLKIDGSWNRFRKSKLNTEKREFESEGYFIDHLVKDLLIHVPDGDKIARAFYKLDRFQRARFTKEFFKFHEEQNQKNPPIQLNRTNVILDDLHFVFIYFNTSMPQMSEELLEGFVEKSIHHHNYLMSYDCQEVIAIAFSQDLKSFGFGYISQDDPLTDDDKKIMEDSFRALGWKLKDV